VDIVVKTMASNISFCCFIIYLFLCFSLAKMPSESQYYWEIFCDLLESWLPRPREFAEVVELRQKKLSIRIPKALRQYRNEVDSMAEIASTDRRQKASGQARGVLGEAILSRLLSSKKELLIIQDLESNRHIKLAKEKFEAVIEESFPLLTIIRQYRSEDASSGRHHQATATSDDGHCSASPDPILSAMRGNLQLRILELHDVLTVARSLDGNNGDHHDGVSVLNILNCVERFVAFADNVGAKCGVFVCPLAAGHIELTTKEDDCVGDEVHRSGAVVAAATADSDDKGYCSVM
jgi:hypothetical protein